MISFTVAAGLAYPSLLCAQELQRVPALEPGAPDTQAPADAALPAEYDPTVLEALEAFEQRDWRRARALFQRAHGLHPTARTLRTIGMCAFNEGDMVGALQNLEASLDDTRKPLTEDQRRHVRGLIQRADERVGRVRLLLDPAHATVQVDGKSPAMLPGGELVLEPGRHEIVIWAEGYGSRTQHVRVAARDRATIELRLQRTPATAAEGRREPPARRSPIVQLAPAGDAARDADGWAWATLSVGAVGAVTGGVTTALALSKKSSLDAACPDRRCGPMDHGLVDDYETLRTIAIVGGAVGLVGIATGTVLLLTGEGEPERAPAIEAMIGPGFAGVRGRL